MGFYYRNTKKDFEKAESMYRKAIESDDKHVRSYCNLADLVQRIKSNYDEADKLYRQALAVDPNAIDALINLGHNAMSGWKDHKAIPEEAADFYRRALVVDPSRKNIHWSLGAAYLKMADAAAEADKPALYDKALAAYDGALAVDPNYGFVYIDKIALLKKLNRTKEASVACVAYGDTFRGVDNAKAEAQYAEAIKYDPTNKLAFERRAKALDAMDRKSDAAAVFVQFGKVLLMGDTPDNTGAESAFNTALSKDPKCKDAYVALFELLTKLGRTGDADDVKKRAKENGIEF